MWDVEESLEPGGGVDGVGEEEGAWAASTLHTQIRRQDRKDKHNYLLPFYWNNYIVYRAFHKLPQIFTANHATFPLQMYAITV